jgi:hypothetical protein
MRKTTAMATVMFVAALLLFSACKGSSTEPASQTNTQPSVQPSVQPTSVVVKLSTVGTLSTGKKIGAIDVTLALAPGVTLKSTENPPATDSGVVAASGVAAANSLVAANYTAATSTLPGTVHIGLINVNGFATGEFATVNGDIAAGSAPGVSDFSVTALTVDDIDGAPLAGMTAGIAAELR